ncbi:MAG: M23 family metallopeptidase [Patescibacteria group bacterium]
MLKSGEVLVWSGSRSVVAFRPLGQLFFKSVTLPLYGRYLWFKSQLTKKSSQRTDKFLLLLTSRYLYHILLVLLGIGVVTSNLLAYENKEDYGQNALVYKLAGLSDIEIIEDSNNIFDDTKIYNYQDQGLYVQGNFYSDSQGVDQDNIYTDQSMAVQGDLALIKPVVSTDEAKNTVGVIQEYEVVQGDSIGKIAARFGVSVNTILWANNLSFSSYVKPGQKLIVPSMSGVVYKVVKGDTISKIAKKYGIPEAKIVEANALSEDNLTIGKLVIVPGAKIIETAKPRVVATTAAVPARTAADNEVVVQGTGSMSWPNGCYRISQYYKGWLHTGLDIACPWGTPLRAADSGTVTRVQYGRTGYGYNVIINHGGGISTLYGHMSRIDVVVGQSVEKGEVIGAEGSTGRSTGPHLHFEVRINGTQVNPLGYIR